MDRKNTGILIGLLIGVTSGFLAGGTVSGFIGYQRVKKAEQDARSGWKLVPVVVAARDIPEGEVMTFDMVNQRNMPEQFVTASVVKPDSATYIINHRLNVPVKAGDMLLWSQFEPQKVASPATP